jgi:hypothetical protein
MKITKSIFVMVGLLAIISIMVPTATLTMVFASTSESSGDPETIDIQQVGDDDNDAEMIKFAVKEGGTTTKEDDFRLTAADNVLVIEQSQRVQVTEEMDDGRTFDRALVTDNRDVDKRVPITPQGIVDFRGFKEGPYTLDVVIKDGNRQIAYECVIVIGEKNEQNRQKGNSEANRASSSTTVNKKIIKIEKIIADCGKGTAFSEKTKKCEVIPPTPKPKPITPTPKPITPTPAPAPGPVTPPAGGTTPPGPPCVTSDGKPGQVGSGGACVASPAPGPVTPPSPVTPPPGPVTPAPAGGDPTTPPAGAKPGEFFIPKGSSVTKLPDGSLLVKRPGLPDATLPPLTPPGLPKVDWAARQNPDGTWTLTPPLHGTPLAPRTQPESGAGVQTQQPQTLPIDPSTFTPCPDPNNPACEQPPEVPPVPEPTTPEPTTTPSPMIEPGTTDGTQGAPVTPPTNTNTGEPIPPPEEDMLFGDTATDQTTGELRDVPDVRAPGGAAATLDDTGTVGDRPANPNPLAGDPCPEGWTGDVYPNCMPPTTPGPTTPIPDPTDPPGPPTGECPPGTLGTYPNCTPCDPMDPNCDPPIPPPPSPGPPDTGNGEGPEPSPTPAPLPPEFSCNPETEVWDANTGKCELVNPPEPTPPEQVDCTLTPAHPDCLPPSPTGIPGAIPGTSPGSGGPIPVAPDPGAGGGTGCPGGEVDPPDCLLAPLNRPLQPPTDQVAPPISDDPCLLDNTAPGCPGAVEGEEETEELDQESDDPCLLDNTAPGCPGAVEGEEETEELDQEAVNEEEFADSNTADQDAETDAEVEVESDSGEEEEE